MVAAVYYDGRRARPHNVEVTLQDGELRGVVEGADLAWPLASLRVVEAGGSRVRLARAGESDERLVLPRADWLGFTGQSEVSASRAERRREWKLVAGLTAAGVALGLAVFVGIPAAAGPLTRITPIGMEATIGANIERQLNLAMKPCDGDAAGAQRLQELADRLAAHSDSPFPIHVEAVRAPMVNAFALPGGTVLVTDGMIELAKTPDELAGVLAHEIAHVERRHAMHAAWRSMGVGLVLDAVVGGGTGAGQQAVLLAGGLTEQRFSRTLESEADARAVEMLRASGISTRGMADLFQRMAGRKGNETVRQVAEWFSTHPDTVRRSERLRAAAAEGQPALSAAEWRQLKAVCERPQDSR